MSTTSQITNPYISVDSLPLNDHRYAGVVIVTRARAEAITCLTMKYLNAQKEKMARFLACLKQPIKPKKPAGSDSTPTAANLRETANFEQTVMRDFAYRFPPL